MSPICHCVRASTKPSQVVKRLEKQLETLPYSCDPPEWEALLVQFNKELHPDHFLCMKVSVTVFVTASVIAFVTVFVNVLVTVFDIVAQLTLEECQSV